MVGYFLCCSSTINKEEKPKRRFAKMDCLWQCSAHFFNFFIFRLSVAFLYCYHLSSFFNYYGQLSYFFAYRSCLQKINCSSKRPTRYCSNICVCSCLLYTLGKCFF